MRAHKPLTPEQTRKAISMHKEGATHADICAALHLPKHQIGEVITGWTKANLPALQRELRAFIEANLTAGKSSMILPKSSQLVSRPVLAEYAKRYTVTMATKLSCTWHQFTAKTKRRERPLHVPGYAHEHLNECLKAGRISDAMKAGKCVKCGTRPQMGRRKKCVECCAEIRRMNRGSLCD